MLLLGVHAGAPLRAQRPAAAPPAAVVSWLIRPQSVFDAASDQVHPGWVVLVTGNRIVSVGPASTVTVPPEARTIELPGMTLLPGLIEAHTHIFLHAYDETPWNDQVLKEPDAYRTIEAVLHCERTLLAGFTTLRDLGTEGAGYADVSVQRAINEGLIPGPRLFVATRAIVATASYGPGPAGFAPNVDLPKGAQEASGVPEVLKAVREQVGHGADWVKVYADYRRGAGPSMPTFSEEELKALVSEAHSAGKPVSAHASTAEGMRRAVSAGVDTIEHGYGGTDEVFAMMADRNVALFPTLAAVEASAEYPARTSEAAPPRGRWSRPGRPCNSRSNTTSSSDWAVTWVFTRMARTTARPSGSCGMASRPPRRSSPQRRSTRGFCGRRIGSAPSSPGSSRISWPYPAIRPPTSRRWRRSRS